MKTFITVLLLASGVPAFAQEKTEVKESEPVRLYADGFVFESKETIIMHEGGTKMPLGKNITIEADSASFDPDRDVLITYGTRTLKFNNGERSFTGDNDTRVFYLKTRSKSD